MTDEVAEIEAKIQALSAEEKTELIMEAPGLGDRVGAEVKRVSDLLLEHPDIEREVGSGRREFSLHRFPFPLI